MCAHVLKTHREGEKHNIFYRASEKTFNGMISIYRHSLEWVLENPGLTLIVLALTIALNFLVIVKIPKGFFPQQDTGVIMLWPTSMPTRAAATQGLFSWR